MRQPWKQWTWKQRVAYSAVLTPVALFLFLLNVAVNDTMPQLVVFGIILLILVPAGYVLFSASSAADRRHAAGDDTAYSPAVRRSIAKKEAKRSGHS